MSYKSARKRAGLTMAKASELIGVTQACISLWETGKTEPRTRTLRKTAEVYGCTVDDLLTKDGDDHAVE